MSSLATLTTSAAAATLLKKREVCQRLSMSERSLEGMVKSAEFPPPVRMGRHMYWSEVAVSGWIQRRFHAQEAWSPFDAREAATEELVDGRRARRRR